MKSSYNLHLHYAPSKPMETFNPTMIHLPLSTPITQMPCYYSTKRYMVSNNHHAWDFKLSLPPWKCHHGRLLHLQHLLMISSSATSLNYSSCNSIVSELNSHSGSETLHPNIQPIGEPFSIFPPSYPAEKQILQYLQESVNSSQTKSEGKYLPCKQTKSSFRGDVGLSGLASLAQA